MTLILSFVLLFSPLQAASPAAIEPASLFASGLTFEQFLDRATAQRPLWLRNTSQANVPRALSERLRLAGAGLRFLVVAEYWCPDSANTVPYIAALARAAGLDLRIVDRTDGEPIMKAHRTPDGRTATPTVVFLRDGRDVGAWVERPEPLQTWFLSMAENPESARRFADKQAWYDSDLGITAISEIIALAEHTAGPR